MCQVGEASVISVVVARPFDTQGQVVQLGFACVWRRRMCEASLLCGSCRACSGIIGSCCSFRWTLRWLAFRLCSGHVSALSFYCGSACSCSMMFMDYTLRSSMSCHWLGPTWKSACAQPNQRFPERPRRLCRFVITHVLGHQFGV